MGGHAIYRQNTQVFEMQKFHLCLHVGVDERTDVSTCARFCQNQNFLDA